MLKSSHLFYLLLAVTLFSTNANAQIITTIGGNGTAGYSGDGGPATAAQISTIGIATDTAGNVFTTEYHIDRVRKISTAGTISTFAGTGVGGYAGDGGPATSAQMVDPTGAAVDRAGNLYIAECNNHIVRKVSATGIISTVAGNLSIGSSGDGGPATAASLYRASDVAVDTSGNLYIADYSSNNIRKVNTAGIISTYAGTGTAGFSGDGGPATAAEVNWPYYVATDLAGNVYFSDRGNNRVRKINTAGIITTIAGTGTAGFSGDGGSATAAMLDGPGGMAFDKDGNFYFCDQNNNRIRKIDAAGIISTIAGSGTAAFSGDGGPATAAALNQPASIAITGGTLFISDQGNARIRKINGLLTSLESNTIKRNNQDRLAVYPSPAKGMFAVNFTSATDEQVSIAISDIGGRIVKRFTTAANTEKVVRINNPGVYVVEAISATGNHTEKVIVE